MKLENEAQKQVLQKILANEPLSPDEKRIYGKLPLEAVTSVTQQRDSTLPPPKQAPAPQPAPQQAPAPTQAPAPQQPPVQEKPAGWMWKGVPKGGGQQMKGYEQGKNSAYDSALARANAPNPNMMAPPPKANTDAALQKANAPNPNTMGTTAAAKAAPVATKPAAKAESSLPLTGLMARLKQLREKSKKTPAEIAELEKLEIQARGADQAVTPPPAEAANREVAAPVSDTGPAFRAGPSSVASSGDKVKEAGTAVRNAVIGEKEFSPGRPMDAENQIKDTSKEFQDNIRALPSQQEAPEPAPVAPKPPAPKTPTPGSVPSGSPITPKVDPAKTYTGNDVDASKSLDSTLRPNTEPAKLEPAKLASYVEPKNTKPEGPNAPAKQAKSFDWADFATNMLDVAGVGLSAYGGTQRKTRKQLEMEAGFTKDVNKALEEARSLREQAVAKVAANAQADSIIKQINAEYAAKTSPEMTTYQKMIIDAQKRADIEIQTSGLNAAADAEVRKAKELILVKLDEARALNPEAFKITKMMLEAQTAADIQKMRETMTEDQKKQIALLAKNNEFILKQIGERGIVDIMKLDAASRFDMMAQIGVNHGIQANTMAQILAGGAMNIVGTGVGAVLRK